MLAKKAHIRDIQLFVQTVFQHKNSPKRGIPTSAFRTRSAYHTNELQEHNSVEGKAVNIAILAPSPGPNKFTKTGILEP